MIISRFSLCRNLLKGFFLLNSNKIRKAGQDQVELRNNDDINIPFARLSSTQRQPLSGFPKIWASFPDERIKFIRNVVEFNLELKNVLS